MVNNKHFPKIIVALTVIAVVLCIGSIIFVENISAALGGTAVTMEYESALFDTDELIEINIIMDEEDWETMLSSAMSEEYYVCDVEINGLKLSNVAIRPKGNTSLSAIASDPDSDRYSIKLEFDHFVEGQTCYGLDKLILNNNYADATNMKEAIVYDMYQYLGADASLYNYAVVSVNGEYTGVYLALEAVEQSFMLRNYGTQDGELYKPESMGIGGDNEGGPGGDIDFGDMPQGGGPGGGGGPQGGPPDMGDFNPEDMGDFNPEDMGEGSVPGDMPNGDFNPEDMGDFNPEDFNPEDFDFGDFNLGDMGGGGFSMGGGGADLNYTDDDLDSYSTIWDGEVTSTGKKDHTRVVEALKNISEGNDIETYMDVDNILKYMAVHTFVVNMDSLSGTMSHNYYLYEYDGQLNIIPWDYNLSFGGMFNSGDATEMINDAIDTPFSGTEFFDALLENDEYLAKYHEYLNQLVEEYVYGGRFDEVYERIRSQIDDLVDTDPTAFYTYDEYDTAAELFYKVIYLRADSVRGQLDGTIPSTDDGQREDDSSLIDGSDIDVSLMGQFDMGGP